MTERSGLVAFWKNYDRKAVLRYAQQAATIREAPVSVANFSRTAFSLRSDVMPDDRFGHATNPAEFFQDFHRFAPRLVATERGGKVNAGKNESAIAGKQAAIVVAPGKRQMVGALDLGGESLRPVVSSFEHVMSRK